VAEPKIISVKVKRFTPGLDKHEPRYQTYQVEVSAPSSVLNILDQISATQDPTLSYQASCRRGFCSICTVKVNGKAVKTCLQQVDCDLLLEPSSRPDKVFKDLAIKW
jgi:succinate dehydrogenase/fumarate reductase-like Fe-S protein